MPEQNNIYNFTEAAKLLNTRFYQAIKHNFSNTRQNPWPGWERLSQEVFPHLPKCALIIDFACGNMRFAKFCAKKLDQFFFMGLDYNEDLPKDFCEHSLKNARQKIDFIQADLLKGFDFSQLSNTAHLVVCFGFFHHIPSYKQRVAVLQQLIDNTKYGGFVCINLWQFMKNDKLAAKTQESTKLALAYFKTKTEYQALTEIRTNSYFLGWEKQKNVFRYCHHFSDEEVDRLEKDVNNAKLINSYNADGRNNNLNRYLIFKNEFSR
ncbi:MAG: class I SAM-dependent methyltransferase [Eggerthellaceae bacterium]|nr:class I SAM-dependent methyltransferase [Eggerthellaceae bacterium]